MNNNTAKNIDEILRFFLSKLLPNDIFRNLSVEINHVKNLHEIANVIMDEDDNGVPDLLSYILNIRNVKKDIIANLAHECVHIKQYALGELRYDCFVKKTNETISLEWSKVWFGECWYEDNDEDSNYDSPWEIEAYGKEVGLVKRWKNYKKERENK